MSRLTDLKQRLIDYQAAGATAGSLQDISAMRMQEIRKQFDENRAFYDEIRSLYALVRTSARQEEVAATLAPKKKAPAAKPAAKTRILYVAITSNRHFLGSLIHDIIATFVAALAKEPAATGIVIGSTGWQHYEQLGVPARSHYLALAGDVPMPEEYRVLHERLAGFDRIFVIYPRFVNPFQQDVTTLDITQSPAESVESAAGVGEQETYIFEPEVPAILSFFDSQVRWVLLGRVMLEAELARTAARLMRMGDAEDRVEKLIKEVEGDIRQEVAVLSNMELLETFAGFATWHHS